MRVTLNGEARDLRDGLMLGDLIVELGLAERRIAVELNRDIVPRTAYAAQALCEGDVLEIVQFVGGG
jgi:sulfur carrier protein